MDTTNNKHHSDNRRLNYSKSPTHSLTISSWSEGTTDSSTSQSAGGGCTKAYL